MATEYDVEREMLRPNAFITCLYLHLQQYAEFQSEHLPCLLVNLQEQEKT